MAFYTFLLNEKSNRTSSLAADMKTASLPLLLVAAASAEAFLVGGPSSFLATVPPATLQRRTPTHFKGAW